MMALLRTDVERALDELVSQEEGMRFQGLAVVLGKKFWPELVSRQRKKDFGLDAYAPASLAPDSIGKGLAASITPTLKKISDDAKTAKEHFPDLRKLLFVTPAKVGNADRRRWEEAIPRDHGVELHLIEREEIITQMMMPENVALCASFLSLHVDAEPQIADLVERAKRAATTVARAWAIRTKGHPLIDLAAVRLEADGAVSADVLSLEQIDLELQQSGRIVLEGPAGRGKTTTLIQLAQRERAAGTALMVELPAWTSSQRGILEYVAGMPAFQAEGLTAADLARVQSTEPFLFLLNGWNEISESNSLRASDALRELERDFPGAGIIVATRTHHLTPPLPGAIRLRLSRLQRTQRLSYLVARLKERHAELRARIDSDRPLDQLTRTPFILSEVVSLFEAGLEIPSTKIGILGKVLLLQEQRDEHRNALRAAPIFGVQEEYLKAIATEMTRLGATTMPEADTRTVVAAITRDLFQRGQIDQVGAPGVLATLTAHHVLERVDYPYPAFQFEHQQLQEYYAALDVRELLLSLKDDDYGSVARFTASYVNDPVWAEPLRMIAETFAEQTVDGEVKGRNVSGGVRLLAMALTVDLVFTAELAQLCGTSVWNEVRSNVGERFRTLYAIGGGSFQEYVTSAMLASGADDFSDLIVPLLSDQDQQIRLSTYRLWPDFHVSSLGENWRELVRGWDDGARADFVSELLHHRTDDDIAIFAAEDGSAEVKKAAVSGLMWTGFDDGLIRVLESLDVPTFEEVCCQNPERMPDALMPQVFAAMRKFVETTKDGVARLRVALDLVDLGQAGMEGIIRNALVELRRSDMRSIGPRYVQTALKHLCKADPDWVSEWVVVRIAEGALYDPESWLPFATVIPDSFIERYLQRLETEDVKPPSLAGMMSIIAAGGEASLAARVFGRLCELRRMVDGAPDQRHELEWAITRQLEAVYRHLPGEVAAAGILSSVTSGDALDIKVAAGLLSRVARPDAEAFQVVNEDLRLGIRTYLKNSVDVVLYQNDFSGEEKANLASAIAQVGQPEDMVDLVRLIHADIERVRRGRAARLAGDRGPLGNGGTMSYASWHISAVMHLREGASEQVLIELLPEPEYCSEAAAAMARDFLPSSVGSFNRALRYDLIWAARKGEIALPGSDQRRAQFSAALNAEIKRQQEGGVGAGLKNLAMALAAVDGLGSASVVLDAISTPGQWDQHTCLDASERLLTAGVILPVSVVFALVDSMVERTNGWMQESDRYLVKRILSLCPFVDDPFAGVAKIRDVLELRQFRGGDLRELINALGQSRSDAAVDFLCEWASDARTFEHYEDDFISAFASLDTARAREWLLGFVDPEIRGVVSARRYHANEVLIARLADLARRSRHVAERMRDLCQSDLPEVSRDILSRVMSSLGTSEALAANLDLIDDAEAMPIPKGIWDQLESACVEQRPFGQSSNVFTQHARASNELRVLLFRMAVGDQKRHKSASILLGKIEEWRLEYGRPAGEPRHPDLASGRSWPPVDF
ncbi:UNVERIFIED_ORG: hypothetical protein EDF86_2201 [Pseudomonas psychrophila]